MNVQIISVIQIVLAIILTVLILLQNKGVGLGSAFGGGTGFYHTKRGFEKLLFYATIITSVLFLVSSATRLVL